MIVSSPDGLSVFVSTDGLCLRVSWNAVDSADSYKLYRSEIPYDDFSLATTTTGLTYFDKPTRPNDNWDYRWYYCVSTTVGLTDSALSGPATWYNYSAFAHDPVPHLCWSSLF